MMQRLAELGFQPFDWPDELKVRDHGRDENRWAVVVDGRQDVMQTAMKLLRKVANRAYKLPRAMRFRSPGMYVFGVVDTPEGIDAQLERWAISSMTSTMIGGEVFFQVLIDPRRAKVVCPHMSGRVGDMRKLMYRPEELAARLLG